MEWVPRRGWLTKIAIDADAAAARLSTSRSMRPVPVAVPCRGRARPAGRRRPDRDRGDSAGSRAVVRRRVGIGAIVAVDRALDRRRLADLVDVPVTSRLRPRPRAVPRPAGRGVSPWSAGSRCRSGWRRSPRPGSRLRACARPATTADDRDPLLAVHAGRGGRARPASRSRSCSSTPTRSTTSGSWVTRRSTSATGPARSRIHGARPTEVSIPAGTTVTTTVAFDQPGDYLYICHLPGPRGLRHGRRAAGAAPLLTSASAVDHRRLVADRR